MVVVAVSVVVAAVAAVVVAVVVVVVVVVVGVLVLMLRHVLSEAWLSHVKTQCRQAGHRRASVTVHPRLKNIAAACLPHGSSRTRLKNKSNTTTTYAFSRLQCSNRQNKRRAADCGSSRAKG